MKILISILFFTLSNFFFAFEKVFGQSDLKFSEISGQSKNLCASLFQSNGASEENLANNFFAKVTSSKYRSKLEKSALYRELWKNWLDRSDLNADKNFLGFFYKEPIHWIGTVVNLPNYVKWNISDIRLVDINGNLINWGGQKKSLSVEWITFCLFLIDVSKHIQPNVKTITFNITEIRSKALVKLLNRIGFKFENNGSQFSSPSDYFEVEGSITINL